MDLLRIRYTDYAVYPAGRDMGGIHREGYYAEENIRRHKSESSMNSFLSLSLSLSLSLPETV